MKIVQLDRPADKIQCAVNDDGSAATVLHKQAPGPLSRGVSFVEGKSLADVMTGSVNEDESIALLDSTGAGVGLVANC
jgi:hypothetical protein